MSTTAVLDCLPPSERDLDAYTMVMTEDKSTREVAGLLKISQTRVRQIVKRVGKYLVRMAPEAKDPVTQYQRTYVAEALGLARLKYMYQQAMQAYRDSRGKQTVVIETPNFMGGSKVVRRTTESFGEIKYLQIAMRISSQMAKIPDNLLLTDAYARLVGEELEDEAKMEAQVAAEFGVEAPLNEDCSAEGDWGAADDKWEAGLDDASGFNAMDYSPRAQFFAGASQPFAPSAQRLAIMPAAAHEEAPAVASKAASPVPVVAVPVVAVPVVAVPASAEQDRPKEQRRLLSRRERRARERMLEKARRKAK